VNIFVLSKDPKLAAQMHCDKHVPKMVVESAQMLSTAHRMLDGKEYIAPSKSGKRMVKHYKLPINDDKVYKAVHSKHPCTVWTMETHNNYMWHYELFKNLSKEYEFRFGKKHQSWELLKNALNYPPDHIPTGFLTKFALAMPEEYKTMKFLTFLLILIILNGCLPLTILSLGSSIYDRYEKEKIEERLEQLEKKDEENARPILQHGP
jgi:hypothetical protein